MAKNKGTQKVSHPGIIISIATTVKGSKVKFQNFDLTPEKAAEMTEMVQRGSGIFLNITSLPKDKKFPPIQVKSSLKGYEINQTCGNPSFQTLPFTSTQCELVTRYIQGEMEVQIEIEQPQGELAFTYGEEEE